MHSPKFPIQTDESIDIGGSSTLFELANIALKKTFLEICCQEMFKAVNDCITSEDSSLSNPVEIRTEEAAVMM
jgi:hypothetical protein